MGWGCALGPGVTRCASGPTLGARSRASGPPHKWLCGPGPRASSLGFSGGLFAHSASDACAGAPAPARVRSGAARPPPLRGAGPAFSPVAALLRPRPPGPAPRLPRSASSGLAPSVGARWPRCAWRAIRSAAGFLRCPCSAPVRLGASRCPAGSPWPRPACASLRPASGAAGSAPGAWAAQAPPFPALAPGAFCCARGPARALLALLWGSPLHPPAPPPPLGAPGCAWLALARGLRAPAWGLRFAALPGGPPGDQRCSCGLFGSFDNPEIVNRLHKLCSKRPAAVLPLSGCCQGFPPAGAPALTLPGIFLPGGLDFSGPVCYFVCAWLASRPLGGHLSRCPRRERKPLCCEAGRLFFMLWLACPAAPVT